jgi:hypothetical protein
LDDVGYYRFESAGSMPAFCVKRTSSATETTSIFDIMRPPGHHKCHDLEFTRSKFVEPFAYLFEFGVFFTTRSISIKNHHVKELHNPKYMWLNCEATSVKLRSIWLVRRIQSGSFVDAHLVDSLVKSNKLSQWWI